MIFGERLSGKKLRGLMGEDVVFVRKTSSTFDIPVGQDGFARVVVAASQTGGRGRYSRLFYSPKGGVYVGLAASNMPLLTVNTAVGVMRTLDKFGVDSRVKWVNDILVDGKKVCGILAKSDGASGAVVGVGVNFCIKKFPKEIRERAGSVFENTDGINRFAATLVAEIRAAHVQNNLDFYRSRLAGVGQDVLTEDGKTVTIKTVDEQGRLVCTADGEEVLLSCGDIII